MDAAGASSASTNDCQPIQFDNASQVESLLESIRAASQAHIDAACKGKDAKYSSTVQDLLERAVLTKLPHMIQQNITVGGLSWDDHRAKSQQATQPVDAVLLRKTIEAQDEAFALSSLACLRRESKTKQLASQVDSRIQAVLASGQEKSKLLDSQRARRESRRRIVHADVPSKPQVEADLRQVEELLQATADLLQQQLARARRAEDVADQVRSLST